MRKCEVRLFRINILRGYPMIVINGVIGILICVLAGVILSKLSGLLGAIMFKELKIILEFFEDSCFVKIGKYFKSILKGKKRN